MSYICKCINSQELIEIRHVQGNVLRLSAPITKRTVTLVNGSKQVTNTDIIPSGDVSIELNKGGVPFTFIADMEGNMASIEDKGILPIGVYSITILFQDAEGNPYRYKKNAVLRIVDTTAEGEVYDSEEFNVIAYYPVIEGRSSAIVVTDDSVYLEVGGKIGADDDEDEEATLYNDYGEGSIEETDDEIVIYI